jgi:NodT family efflux transporter outer membrane factor (OMF) lipoprotein
VRMRVVPVIFSAFLMSGCPLVGPDFETPESHVSGKWMTEKDPRLSAKENEYREWWKGFNDPILNHLVDLAYAQNLSLRATGVKILSARAQLGIAIGDFYPQQQKIDGLAWDIHLPQSGLSERLPGSNSDLSSLWLDRLGPTVNWEIDLWGKFRRAIESADASMLGQVANYDSMLVSLTGDVANNYIGLRTIERRLDIARSNIEVQRGSLKIAESKFRGGSSSRRDVEQAKTVLASTQALIPKLEALLRTQKNLLCYLLGQPPHDVDALLGSGKQFGQIPTPPVQVAVGVPLDLLRRRPDIREAEYQAQAQAAQIGVAEAQLYPAFSITGSFAFVSSSAPGHSLSDMFAWGNNFYRFGPGIQWNILNYGQITNQIRYNDALYQSLIIAYQDKVLKAQMEVEDGLIFFLKLQDSAEFLAQSTGAAKRSLDLATLQYKEGIADFTTVLTAEQSLLQQQDSFATTLGEVAGSLVTVYRSMGGGWQIREGRDFVPEEIRQAMANRTGWGHLLETFKPETGPAQGTIRAPEW